MVANEFMMYAKLFMMYADAKLFATMDIKVNRAI